MPSRRRLSSLRTFAKKQLSEFPVADVRPPAVPGKGDDTHARGDEKERSMRVVCLAKDTPGTAHESSYDSYCLGCLAAGSKRLYALTDHTAKAVPPASQLTVKHSRKFKGTLTEL